MDAVRQSQAYLLAEAEEIKTKIRSEVGPNRFIASTMLVTTESPTSTPSTSVNVKRESFFDLPDEFTTHCQPQIKVYKTYIDDDGTEHDYLLPMGEYLGRVANADGVDVETTRGVVVKSAEFTRLGGNPAEIDTNIKFNLKLFAQDITTFFVKNETTPVVPYTPQYSEELIFKTARQSQMLTAMYDAEDAFDNNATSVTAAAIALSGAPDDPALNAALAEAAAAEVASVAAGNRGLGSIRYRDLARERYERTRSTVTALAHSAATVGANGERRSAWIDLIKINPGQPLNNGDDDTALVTSENQVRIKVEIGYATPNTKPTKYTGTDWEEWAEVIGNQREVFYLSLFKHNFEFRGYDGVDLSIDFIASGNARQLSPEADLFSNPKMQTQLARLRSALRQKEEELKLAENQEGEITSITVDCMENISLGIGQTEKKIREINSKNKLRLLNQIYLNPTSAVRTNRISTSRLFFRSYDPQSTSSEVKNRQFNPGYSSVESITATANGFSDSRANNTDMSLSVIDQDFATRDDDATVEATTTLRGSGTLGTSRMLLAANRQGSAFPSNHFIFLGDIIDAAFEILVPTDTQGSASENVSIDTAFSLETNETFTRDWQETIDSPDEANIAERIGAITSLFGGFIGGWVTYTNPNNITEEKSIPIRDIPIALDVFRSWWLNNYVKSSRRTLGIKDFIVQLMKFVETDVFKNIPLEFGTNEDNIDTPRFIVNVSMIDEQFLATLYNEATSRPRGQVTEDALRSATSGLMGGKPVLLIEQSNNNPAYNELTATITFGETNKGILKGVTFEREDIPGHAEARLFSDRTSVAGNIALREKYNTKLDLIGTTSLSPGSLFYLDPLPLDLGWAKGEKRSFARQLGLGGMYRVVNVTSNINFDSAGSIWETTVNTKWESFGDGDDGVTAVAQAEQALGRCADLEATAADARANRAVAEVDEAQFDGNY